MHAALRKRWSSLGREDVRALQGRRLHTFLRRCVLPYSRHYAQLFAEQGLTADHIRSVDDLQRLPFTDKADLLPTPDNPKRILDFVLQPQPEVLRRRFATIAQALRHGPAAARDALEREWRPTFLTSTTGRSAEPVPFVFTQYDLANLRLGGGRIVELGRCAPDERLLNLFPYAPHLGYWLVHHACLEKNLFQVGTGGGKCMGTTGNIRLIERVKPQLLVGMPTFLYHVLSEAFEGGKQLPGIRLLVLGGEKVPTGMRRKLAELCTAVGSPGVQVVATYGFTEARMAWAECPSTPGEQEPTGYHLYPDLGIVEVIDPQTGMVVPDGTPGEIVYTAIDGRGTIVLRYRTGDRIEGGLVHERCPGCGRMMPRLIGRISRVADIRVVQTQKIKGTIVDFNAIEHLLDDLPDVKTWQVELRKRNDDPLEVDELVVHLCVRDGAASPAIATRIANEFVAAFELRPNAVEFHSMEELRRMQRVGEVLKEERVVDHRPPAREPSRPAASSAGRAETPARERSTAGADVARTHRQP